ncbi:hypothetical protein [Paludibacterium denitrificans]|uniref:Uncharacterized protein n=1 Tax=Paludibacterium denitrificans TaxID=2675226 RepID=A0A844GE56_9NEIS|nr:hypothetical protein [Paludibacterium denitrificans]MTD33600.1 hypothetical protein [Paludibacterium denitrificans]
MKLKQQKEVLASIAQAKRSSLLQGVLKHIEKQFGEPIRTVSAYKRKPDVGPAKEQAAAPAAGRQMEQARDNERRLAQAIQTAGGRTLDEIKAARGADAGRGKSPDEIKATSKTQGRNHNRSVERSQSVGRD